MTSLSLKLYFDANASSYRENLGKVIAKCRLIESMGVHLEQFEKSVLLQSDLDAVANRIRSLIPQKRGSIVTSGHWILPLSNSKKLNLSNTPVAIVERDDNPIYVFPCKVEETYYDLMKGLDHLLSNLEDLPQLRGVSENEIVRIIEKSPEKLENGLVVERKEVPVEGGVIDILFRASDGKHLVVEVERSATDQALGQVLRLCACFEKQGGLGKEDVRGMIACLRANPNLIRAAERAGITVKVLEDVARLTT